MVWKSAMNWTVTVTVSLLETAVKDRIARQSDKQYKLQNQTTRSTKIAENYAQVQYINVH